MDNKIELEPFVADLYNHILHAKSTGNFTFVIGNGGSACQADHIAQDLVGKGYRAISLCMSGSITAIANDIGYGDVFSHQLKVLAKKGDLLITLSTSGSSMNILKALLQAKSQELKIVRFPTNDQTKLSTAYTQDIHSQIFHRVYESL